MNNLGKNVWLWVMGGLLLIYSAYRSFNLLAMTFPPNQSFMAVFGLVALDGGAVLWLLTFQNKGIGGYQRWVAATMIVIDLLGSIMTFLADTLYNTGLLGITIAMDANSILGILVAISLVIGLNIAMTFLYHALDPQASADRAYGDAKAKMQSASLTELKNNMDVYAAEMAPRMAASMVREWQVDDQINIASRLKKAEQLANSSGLNSGKPQLPARKPAPVEPPYSDIEEQETWQAEQDLAEKEKPARKPAPRRVVSLAGDELNPTPRPNGRHA